MKCLFAHTLFLVLFSTSFFACNQAPKKEPRKNPEFPEETIEDSRLDLNQYIAYKKLHSWGDSLYFLVLSWGSDSIGGYTILLADSLGGNYISMAQHRQGGVVQSWINDFDRDSLPEIGIVTRSQNKRRTGQMRLHELGRNFTFETIDMQPLSEQLSADYEGRDIFYPQTGQVIREFQTVTFDSATQERTVRRIIYELDNNQLIVTEFEEETEEADLAVEQDDQ